MPNNIVEYFNPKTPASDTISNRVSALNLFGSNLTKAYESTFNYSKSYRVRDCTVIIKVLHNSYLIAW